MTAPLVFITGASSGIGQALAWRFYQAGWRLALVARRTAEIERWALEKGLDATRHAVYGADVAQTDSIAAAGHACIAAQGVPDVVIANAGISVGMDTAVREDIDVMAQTFATNNIGLAATFHPFIAPMLARGSGTLTGIASVAGIRGLPGHGAYCSSKAAVISYCESLRGELRAGGGAGGDHLPRLHRHAADAPEPLQHAVPDEARKTSPTAHSMRSKRVPAYRVIPWQMGVGGGAVAVVAQCGV
jgi:NADP-dependent 3-hydroxy acid dehydrogenase YdfG